MHKAYYCTSKNATAQREAGAVFPTQFSLEDAFKNRGVPRCQKVSKQLMQL